MSQEHRARVERTSYQTFLNTTEITVSIPGEHDLTRGEIIVLVVSEGTKADQAAIQAEQAEHLRKFYA